MAETDLRDMTTKLPKDVSSPLEEHYNPENVESGWYEWWHRNGFFKPEYMGEPGPVDNTVVTITPPNATGCLHLGHALTITLQDCFTRWHRMKGKKTLWIPGLDHAGVAAQMVVEKRMSDRQRKPVYELDKEEVLEEIKEIVNVLSLKIKIQIQQLGASCDWSRYMFTLDEKQSKAVAEAFCRLHDKDLIYREEGLVHWSCFLRTAISDREIELIEVYPGEKIYIPGCDREIALGEEFSFAYKIIEPVKGGVDEVVVTTTRIEWMLGHTAVVITEDHKDRDALQGKRVKHPFFDRDLPVIVDNGFIQKSERRRSSSVDRSNTGKEIISPVKVSGAQGVVPSHDYYSYKLWTEHQEIGKFRVIDDVGNTTYECGENFRNKNRFEVRQSIIDQLTGLGLFKETRPVHLTLELCSRSRDVIELQLKPQWFINTNGDPHDRLLTDDHAGHNCAEISANGPGSEMHRSTVDQTMTQQALVCFNTAVENGCLRITPPRYEKEFRTTLCNVKPWCISRSGKWGHPIPVYHAKGKKSQEKTCWVSGTSRTIAREKAEEKLKEEVHLTQDTGVLDSWFSCALLPFSVFGWPDKTSDLEMFYPGTILETGDDIFCLWVSRVITIGVELTGQMPVKEIYLHRMINDKTDKKMGRSRGVVIDPCDIIKGIGIEQLTTKIIETYDSEDHRNALDEMRRFYQNGFEAHGVDALRLGLVSYVQPDECIKFMIEDIKESKRFCETMWTAFRNAFRLFGDYINRETACTYPSDKTQDLWMLYLLDITAGGVNSQFEKFDFKEAVRLAKQFWLDLCHWYIPSLIENNKRDLKSVKTLCTCLDQGLRLLHPFMPFITEDLFQRLPRGTQDCESISVMSYPIESESLNISDENSQYFKILDQYLKDVDAIKIERNQFVNFSVEARLPTRVILSQDMRRLFNDIIMFRCKAKKVTFTFDDTIEKAEFCLTITGTSGNNPNCRAVVGTIAR